MALKIDAFGDTDLGQVYTTNEDSVFTFVRPEDQGPALALLIVADGMGGHKAGDVASRLAIDSIFASLKHLLERDSSEDTRPNAVYAEAKGDSNSIGARLEKELQAALENANHAILDYGREHSDEAGNLGCTVTCVLIDKDLAIVANVGDSRTYLFRDDKLTQITNDHSYVAEMIREGVFEPEAIHNHPQRNVLTRALGQLPELEVDTWTLRLGAGDQLLLCSDGLWESLDDQVIAEVLQMGANPENIANELVAAANQQGGRDNIGVVIAHLSEA